MTDKLLSDNELKGIVLGAWHGTDRGYAVARAVEAAVLAKIPRTVPVAFSVSDATVGTTRFVTEREARKRVVLGQREGWDACYAFITALAGRGLLGSRYDYPDKERDIRYPLPTKRVPRTVVLSDGMTVTRGDNNRNNGWCVLDERGRFVFDTATNCPLSLAKTPADARLLADLVERPYDEVPDDA